MTWPKGAREQGQNQNGFYLESGVGGDDGGEAAGAVGVVRGARDDGALADGHLSEALVPAPDDLKIKGVHG